MLETVNLPGQLWSRMGLLVRTLFTAHRVFPRRLLSLLILQTLLPRPSLLSTPAPKPLALRSRNLSFTVQRSTSHDLLLKLLSGTYQFRSCDVGCRPSRLASRISNAMKRQVPYYHPANMSFSESPTRLLVNLPYEAFLPTVFQSAPNHLLPRMQ